MATIRYSADGAISPERFIAALTDFSDRRPELWPNLDTRFFKLHERGETWAEVTEGTDVLGGVWARERYDWSDPGGWCCAWSSRPTFGPAPRSSTG